MAEHDENRTLTEDDVEAVVVRLEARLEERFFSNLGKGVWAILWRACIVIILGITVLGAIKRDGGGFF